MEIIPTPDQDETDFTKCLRIVYEKMDHSEVSLKTVFLWTVKIIKTKLLADFES